MLLSVTRTESYLQFLTVLILFVFVLAITYLVTRWIARYQKGRIHEGNLAVVDTCRIAPGKYIQIIRAGEKYLVIAVGKDEVHMLSELSPDELDLREDAKEQAVDFAGVFAKVRGLKEKDKG